MRRHELSTFDFALLLVAGLAVFTAIVSVVSFFQAPPDRYAVVAKGTPVPPDQAGVVERPGEAVKIKGLNEPGVVATPVPQLFELAEKPASTKDLYPDAPNNIYPSDKKIYYDNQTGRPILNAGNNERLFPGAKGWVERFKELWTRTIHYHTSPDRIAEMLGYSAQDLRNQLDAAERQMRRDGDGVVIRYNKRIDERVVVAEANYLAQVKILNHMAEDNVPGMPDCVSSAPTIQDMTALPKLPTFDPLLRGGEDERSPEYRLDLSVAPNPFETISRMRRHMDELLRCAKTAKNVEGFEYRVGLVDMSKPYGLVRSTDPLTPDLWTLPERELPEGVLGASRPDEKGTGVYGALAPGESGASSGVWGAPRPGEKGTGVYGAASAAEGASDEGVWRALRPGEKGEGVFGSMTASAESEDGVWRGFRPGEAVPGEEILDEALARPGGGPIVRTRPENPTGYFLQPTFVTTRTLPPGVYGPLEPGEDTSKAPEKEAKTPPKKDAEGKPKDGAAKTGSSTTTTTTTSTTTTLFPTTTATLFPTTTVAPE